MVIQRSGVMLSDRVKLKFREKWLPQMTDLNRHPKAAPRASIGRALGSVLLSYGEPLDNRLGVGVNSDGLPDIDWVDIPGGTVRLKGGRSNYKVNPFRIARYLVTNRHSGLCGCAGRLRQSKILERYRAKFFTRFSRLVRGQSSAGNSFLVRSDRVLSLADSEILQTRPIEKKAADSVTYGMGVAAGCHTWESRKFVSVGRELGAYAVQ
jgi:hypothetical protein